MKASLKIFNKIIYLSDQIKEDATSVTVIKEAAFNEGYYMAIVANGLLREATLADLQVLREVQAVWHAVCT